MGPEWSVRGRGGETGSLVWTVAAPRIWPAFPRTQLYTLPNQAGTSLQSLHPEMADARSPSHPCLAVGSAA